jgi:hypothetical protein
MATTEKSSNGVKEDPKSNENSTTDKRKIEQFQIVNDEDEVT